MNGQGNSPPSSSWAGPILLGALATIGLALLTDLLRTLGSGGGAAALCLFLSGAMPLGFLPTISAYRRDRSMTPGQGFAIAFIAVGAGSTIIAVWQTMSLRGADMGLVRSELQRVVQRLAKDGGGTMTQEEIDSFVTSTMAVIPYVPVIAACVLTLCAALVGLATVTILRRREPPLEPSP